MEAIKSQDQPKKVCECRICARGRRFNALFEKMPVELQSELSALWEEVNMDFEADSTDLGVLQACIVGQWPGSESGTFLHRIDGVLYSVTCTKVEEKQPQTESNQLLNTLAGG